MFTEDEWMKFFHTGSVIDYLRYRGIAVAAIEGERRQDATENEGPHHTGEQSYR